MTRVALACTSVGGQLPAVSLSSSLNGGCKALAFCQAGPCFDAVLAASVAPLETLLDACKFAVRLTSAVRVPAQLSNAGRGQRRHTTVSPTARSLNTRSAALPALAYSAGGRGDDYTELVIPTAGGLGRASRMGKYMACRHHAPHDDGAAALRPSCPHSPAMRRRSSSLSPEPSRTKLPSANPSQSCLAVPECARCNDPGLHLGHLPPNMVQGIPACHAQVPRTQCSSPRPGHLPPNMVQGIPTCHAQVPHAQCSNPAP